MNGKATKTSPPTLHQLSEELIKQYSEDKFEQAEKEALKAHRWDWLHFFRAFAMQMRSEYSHAIKEYQEVIRIKPDFVAAYNNMGNCYFALKEYAEALRWYDTHIKLFPLMQNGYVFANRGSVFHALGDFNAAVTSLKVAIDVDPSHEPAYRRLIAFAIELLDKTLFDEVIERYRAGFPEKKELERDIGAAISQFATRLADRGDNAAASAYAEKVASMAHEAPGIAINLGYVNHKSRRFEQAIEFYRMALEHEETRAGALYNLAGIAALTGKTDEAIKLLADAIAASSSFRELARTDEDFEALKKTEAFQQLVQTKAS